MEITSVTSLSAPTQITSLSKTSSDASETTTAQQSQTTVSEDTVSISAEALILQAKYSLAAGILGSIGATTLASQVTDLSSPLVEGATSDAEMSLEEILSVYGQLVAVDTANGLVASAMGIDPPQSVASNPAAILTSAGTNMTRAETYAAYSLLNDFSYRTSLIRAIA